MAHTIPRSRKHPYPLEAVLHGAPTRYAVPDGWKELRDCTAEDLRWHVRHRKSLHDDQHTPHNEDCQTAIEVMEGMIAAMDGVPSINTVGELQAALRSLKDSPDEPSDR